MNHLSLLLLSLSLLFGLLRLFRGPLLLDRLIAFDTMAITSASIAAYFSIEQQSGAYLDLILIFSLLGFVSCVGFIAALYHLKEKA